MKTMLNKIKSEKRKKTKMTDKIGQFEYKLVKIIFANNHNKLQSQLKQLKKIHIVNKYLHEIKQEVLRDYAGEFEVVGNLKIVDQIRQTDIRFRNISDYEANFNSIDEGYDADDAIFNGYIYKIDTLQFNLVNRGQCGNGCDLKHEFIEYRGNYCFIPTNGYCFVKCVTFLIGDDYKEQNLDFIRNEKRRSNFFD